jgi:hypothetical protein
MRSRAIAIAVALSGCVTVERVNPSRTRLRATDAAASGHDPYVTFSSMAATGWPLAAAPSVAGFGCEETKA